MASCIRTLPRSKPPIYITMWIAPCRNQYIARHQDTGKRKTEYRIMRIIRGYEEANSPKYLFRHVYPILRTGRSVWFSRYFEERGWVNEVPAPTRFITWVLQEWAAQRRTTSYGICKNLLPIPNGPTVQGGSKPQLWQKHEMMGTGSGSVAFRTYDIIMSFCFFNMGLDTRGF